MATKQAVQRAAVKKYGRAAHLTYGKLPSSPEKRQAARDTMRNANARMKELESSIKSHGTHTTTLIKAARFVIDTDGDRTALRQLATALALAERQQELKDDHANAAKEYYDTRNQGNNTYYQYKVCVKADSHLPFAIVKHEADTLDEMMELIRTGQQSTPMAATT